ncbi:hypothetical protein [Microbulbifer sp. 2205BS26-8]|uniref:hypothetical protein n=1 Tax=Microbulbifer sp. 2205BS26-8 TaxID=3064386 RepID=UPI00273D04D0|nr:hypothetical protein [Microbulbifer sp. 2205BS26-8]MDP5209469.1 hypothetical protein [Microbulbifer sp. 2205BS26-8]
MRTLYLHIGFHKTGSSSLQLALKHYAEQLKTTGFEFLSLGKKGNSSAAVEVFKRSGRVFFRLNQHLDMLLASSTGESTIVSAEHLCFLHMHRDIEQVYAVCSKYFDDIRVVMYLRRQDLQAVSFKKQSARGCVSNMSSSSKLFGHSEGAFPRLDENIKIYYDYFAKLQLWERVFGRTSLTIREFSSETLRGGDIVSDFSMFLGRDLVIPPCRVNEGIGRKQFLLTHKLLELGVAESEIKKLKPVMVSDKTVLKPSRSAAVDFFMQFKQSNQLLNDHYLQHGSGLAFNGDFSSYPERGNDRLCLQDLAAWVPELFAAGLQAPEGLRDTLLIGRIRTLLMEGVIDVALAGELEGLAQCLTPTAHIAQVREPWYRLIKGRKRSGR